MQRWRRIAVCAFLMAFPTVFLFGPVGGFHHLYVFGIFWYMAWDGEEHHSGYFQFTLGEETFDLIIRPWMLALTIACWLLCLVGALYVTRSAPIPKLDKLATQP